MLEGLAVWALFIYLLRLVGMPWNKGTKAFAYLGGTSWLLFVWVGLVNFTLWIFLAGRLYSLHIFSCVQTQHRSAANHQGSHQSKPRRDER